MRPPSVSSCAGAWSASNVDRSHRGWWWRGDRDGDGVVLGRRHDGRSFRRQKENRGLRCSKVQRFRACLEEGRGESGGCGLLLGCLAMLQETCRR